MLHVTSNTCTKRVEVNTAATAEYTILSSISGTKISQHEVMEFRFLLALGHAVSYKL